MLLSFDCSFDGEESTSEILEWRDAATKKDEPVMHVKPGPRDAWHKMLIDRTRTACGKPLGAYATRDESYTGDLCRDGCFSPFELKLAEELQAELLREDRERERIWAEQANPDISLTRDIARSRRENRVRLDTAKTPKLDPDDK